MHQASVGFHCPECAKGGKQQVYQGIPSLYAKPFLTYALIAVNVAVFLLQLTEPDFGNSGIDRIHLDFGLIARSVGPGGLMGVGEGQWYRLVTAGFLHFGIIHLALNMYALYILGMAMERIGGRLRMGTIYATSLLMGSLGALVLSPDSLTAGASGAIYGLMGGILLAQRAQGVAFRDSPLIGVLVLNFIFTLGLSGHISVGGHIGGFIGGGIAGWALFGASWAKDRSSKMGYALCAAVCVASVVASLAFAAAQPAPF